MTLARPYPIATCILFSQTEMTCGLLNSEVWLPNFSKFKAFLDLALFLVSILKVALYPKGFFNWSHLQSNVPGVYRRSIFKIRPHILIGLQKLWFRPKDRSRLFIYWNFLRQFSFVLPYKVCPLT